MFCLINLEIVCCKPRMIYFSNSLNCSNDGRFLCKHPMFILNTESALGFADVTEIQSLNTKMEAKPIKFRIGQQCDIISPHHHPLHKMKDVRLKFSSLILSKPQKLEDTNLTEQDLSWKIHHILSSSPSPRQFRLLKMIDFSLVGKLGSSMMAQNGESGEMKNVFLFLHKLRQT